MPMKDDRDASFNENSRTLSWPTIRSMSKKEVEKYDSLRQHYQHDDYLEANGIKRDRKGP